LTLRQRGVHQPENPYLAPYPFLVLPLGQLAGEPPEPMTRKDFIAMQDRLRASWSGHVTLDKRDVEKMLNEIRWLRRRLQRVEEAIEPVASDLRRVSAT